jgi:hypothetical protein
MREINNPNRRDSESSRHEQLSQVVGSMECRQVDMPRIEAANHMMTGLVTGITIERTYEDGTFAYSADLRAVEGETANHVILAERARIEQRPPAYAVYTELDGQTFPMAARYIYYRRTQFTSVLVSFGADLHLDDEEYHGVRDAIVATISEKFYPISRQIDFQIDVNERVEEIKLPGELS